MRILCLDIGDKRIGVAVSDEDKMLARGIGNIVKDGSEVKKICGLVEEYGAESIVYGLPLRMDGSMSGQTEKSSAFISVLRQHVPVPCIPFDERLSSKQADSILIEADMSRKKRKKLIDKLAAQIILQNYLDSKREFGEEEDI
ncbi:MAG TPA: Holliday junction resolvase RuvX [bacterium]|jgi:putative Holliday junction resolvase|nr:Holliday junction resolvase RuvX [bacterium]